MKKHIVRGILIVAIVALVTTFAGSASAAGRHRRHHHHQQAPGYSAPRVYSQYPNFSGYRGVQPNYGGYAVPHYDYHYAVPHYDYHDYHYDHHHDSHHGW